MISTFGRRASFSLLTLLLLQRSTGSAHDLKLGFFQCYEEDQQFYLQVKLDREHLFAAIQEAGLSPNSQAADFKKAIFDYVSDHVSLSLNHQLAQLHFFLIEYDEEHIHLKAKIKDIDIHSPIQNIEVSNTCLVNEIDGHENIIQFDLNNRRRSFRLNKSRVQTTFNY